MGSDRVLVRVLTNKPAVKLTSSRDKLGFILEDLQEFSMIIKPKNFVAISKLLKSKNLKMDISDRGIYNAFLKEVKNYADFFNEFLADIEKYKEETKNMKPQRPAPAEKPKKKEEEEPEEEEEEESEEEEE